MEELNNKQEINRIRANNKTMEIKGKLDIELETQKKRIKEK